MGNRSSRHFKWSRLALGGILVAGLLLLTVGCVAAVATPTAAPVSPTAPAPVPTPTKAPAVPITFRIAIGIDPDTMDPAGQTTTTVSNLVDYVLETLIFSDQEGKLKPMLATEWQVSPDGLSVVAKLRQGVTFHDGTPFNAEAVKFSLDRVLNPDVRSPSARSFIAALKETVVVDPYTVRMNLKEVSATFVAALSSTGEAIISPASVDKRGNTFKVYEFPVGTGPYAYEGRVKGERVTLNKYAQYWGEKPTYDKVIVQIVPEAATRESLVLAGQVDMIIHPPISDLPALSKNPAVKVLLAPSNRTIFISINNKRIPDKRVRQAMNYAVDKGTIIEKVLYGAAEVLDAPMAPSLFGYCRIGAYPYNPDKAKALLQEAGAAKLSLNFIAPTGRYVQDFPAAQAISGYLAQVGITATVSTMDWPSYVATITKKPEENTNDLHFLGWAPAILDAERQMVIFETSYHAPKGLGTAFYSNPTVDEMLKKARVEVDTAKRASLYCDASKLVWDEAPWLFLWNQRFPIVYSAKVENVSYLPNEKFYAIFARPAR
jgi:peptide/nickel transport system substrate-binding protein